MKKIIKEGHIGYVHIENQYLNDLEDLKPSVFKVDLKDMKIL